VNKLSLPTLIFFCLAFTATASATVTVSSPTPSSDVASPVHYVATASATSCSKGVAAMGIYVSNQLVYTTSSASLNTYIDLSNGQYYTVVQEWDNCGGASSTAVPITVGSVPNGVSVSSPANNSTVTSPVQYTATAGSPSCAQGVAAMGIYVDNTLAYKTSGSSINTQLSLSGGPHQTVVQEWDNCGGAATTPIDITVQVQSPPTVSMTADSPTIPSGTSSTLTVHAANATQVTITGGGSSWNLSSTGGSIQVSPTQTTTYTAEATGGGSNASSSATVTVVSPTAEDKIQHVIFMLQENHTFDNYFGMLNPYRKSHGWNIGASGTDYEVDGISTKLNSISNSDDEGTSFSPFKFKSTCVDDMTSSWLESYGDVSPWSFSTTRPIDMAGFVHTAENFDKNCAQSGTCSGQFTDSTGQRAMGYYDQTFLNYYYYMASQFALSDRWFSPVSSKSIDNRLATFTGGTTQGLVFDPGVDDHLPQLDIPTIFQELDQHNVSWKIYYSVTQSECLSESNCSGSKFPATDFDYFTYSVQYLYQNPTGAPCKAPTQPSSVVGDSTNSFCIDPNHIAPLNDPKYGYFADLKNGTLPSFSFIEAGFGNDDEHPGSGQSILSGQAAVANIVNSLMQSSSWGSSVFFLSYDEGGGPFDHVPPVPGHSNDFTNPSLGPIPDISHIAVNPDSYNPCVPPNGTPTTHCDLRSSDPGATSTDAAAKQGFAAQLGFRVPNIVISPFTRKHYVSHIPMDHTAVIKFVENRFIGSTANLTARDAAQPNLLNFFNFSNPPWATPPTPPTPASPSSLGYDPCTPTDFAP
jgi:phospholipase C